LAAQAEAKRKHEERIHNASALIQAYIRGYLTRKKMAAAKAKKAKGKGGKKK